MEIQELIKLLLRKKYFLIIIPLFSAAIAFTLRFLSDRIYVSESQISTGLTIKDLPGDNSDISPYEIAISFSNLTENMVSKTVVHRLSYKLLKHDLEDESPFRYPNFEKLKMSAPAGDSLNAVLDQLKRATDNFTMINRTDSWGRYIYDLIEAYKYDEKTLIQNVQISRVGNTDFVNIRFSSEVPRLSAFMVNIWASDFIEFYNYQKVTRLNESLGVLSQLLTDKQKALDESVARLNQFRTRSYITSSDEGNDKVSEYERLIREEESKIRGLNYRLTNIREQISQVNQSTSSQNHQKIITLKSQIDQMSARLINESNNQALLDSLEELRSKLQQEMYLHSGTNSEKSRLDELFKEENNLEVSYEIALQDLNSLKQQYAVQRGAAQNIATQKSSIDNLETEVQQARDEYISAQDKYNQARSELLVGSSSLKLSYSGDIPEDPQSRKTVIFTGLGYIVGMVITLFTILMLEFLDQRLKSPTKFTRETELEATGTIENLKNFSGDLSDIINGNFPGLKEQTAANFLQAFRKLRFEMQSLTGHTILFTSLRKSSGKSFILSSLAYSLSLIERKVLIIDTNFKSNQLSNTLGEPLVKDSAAGLNKLIAASRSNQIPLEDVSREKYIKYGIINKTNNPLIDIIKCQNIKLSPSEVLYKIKFGQIVDKLLQEYHFVFMEGAALNDYSDSEELTNFSEYVIPVFSVDDEFKTKDQKSLKFLKQHKDRLSLVVLNKVKEEDVV